MPHSCRRFLISARNIKAALTGILAALGASGILLSSPDMVLAQFKMPDQKIGRAHVSPQLVHLSFSRLPAAVTNGQMYYVDDGASGTPCTGGGSGALAIGIGGVWSCGPIPGGTGTPSGVSCSHQATFVGIGSFTASSNNNTGSFVTPNTDIDVDNCTVTFSTPGPAPRRCIWSATNADASASFQPTPDVSTSTTAKVDFASAGSNTAGGPLTITYICF
jgi:hypothetical protein